MNAASILKLHSHNGRLLTRPEILLNQFHARRNDEQKKLADEKILEKSMLSRLSSKLIAVPLITKDPSDGFGESKAEMLIKEIESQGQNQNDSNFHDVDEIDDNESIDENIEEEIVESVAKKKIPKRAQTNSSNSPEEDSFKEIMDNLDEEVIADKIEENIDNTGNKRIKKKQRQADQITAASEQDLTAMFAPPGSLLSSDWNTIKDPIMREFKLDNFGLKKNNTLAIKLTVPPGSTRWSFNITPPNHCDSTNILLHFNPRKGKKTELVMNDKQGTWGARDPECYPSLLLSLPVLDDNGNREQAVYHKVWWGITDPSLPFQEVPASVIALVNTELNPAGRRTVLVSGLPQLFDILQLQVLEGALLSLFEDYTPEAVNVVPGESGTAYVKLRDESHVQEFIDVFNGSTVGEDGQDQHTIMLSKYDVMKI